MYVDNTLLLLIFLIMSLLGLFMTYLIYLLKYNDGLRRLFMIINIIIMIYGCVRLHTLWNIPSWGQWVLSFMIPIAVFSIFALILLIVDVITSKRISVVGDDILSFVSMLKQLIPNLKKDFWDFVQFCVVDPNEEDTKQLFNHYS